MSGWDIERSPAVESPNVVQFNLAQSGKGSGADVGYSVEFHMMKTIEEIIEQARHLSPQDRQRLVEQLEELSEEEQSTGSVLPEVPYAQSLALGTAHTDFTDVSTDKYKHLAEAYADRDDNT
jgi:hypothetical protein